MAAYAERLSIHPWGGPTVDRLVVGGVDASLQEWMHPEEYEQWRRTQAVRSVITGAKSFIAADGKFTAVVPRFEDRSLFLHLPGHEMVEAALDKRQLAEGYQFVDQTHFGVAHVLWTEYVVERTRKSIANELGWPNSPLDDAGLVQHAREFEQSVASFLQQTKVTGTEPAESFQHWFELIRVYAMSRGRADAGSPVDEAAFDPFFEETLPAELRAEWLALDDALRQAYDRPEQTTTSLDRLVHDHDGNRCTRNTARSGSSCSTPSKPGKATRSLRSASRSRRNPTARIPAYPDSFAWASCAGDL